MYNEDIPPPAEVAGKKNAGDKWNDSTIKLIITNPHYVGDLVQNRSTTVSVTSKKRRKVDSDKQIIVKDSHEPIISRDVFNAVQQQMKIRTKYITAPKKHLFTNVLFCIDCGKGLWYRSNRKGYICGNFARYGKKACSKHFIKEDLLKATVLSDIQELLKKINKEHYLNQLETQSKKSKQNIQKQLDKIEKAIDTIKGRKRKYINMLAEELISHEDYRENTEANNVEMNNLLDRKNDLLLALESEQTVDNIDKLKQELLQFLNFDELTPEILHRLINRIEVKEDGTPVIHYRFAAPKME